MSTKNPNGGGDGKNAFRARCNMAAESLPTECSITGFSDSATTSQDSVHAGEHAGTSFPDCPPESSAGTPLSPNRPNEKRRKSSKEAAVSYARRAVEARPSVENRLILARCLRAAGEDGAARVVLEEALAAPKSFPRDGLLMDDVRRELE